MEYRVSKLPVHVASRHQSQCPQPFRLQQFEYVFAYVLVLVYVFGFVFVFVLVYVYSLIRLFVSLYLIINSRHSARVRWPFMNYKRRWQRFRFAFDCNWQTREAERQRRREEVLRGAVLDAVVGSFGLCSIWRMHKRYALRPKTCMQYNAQFRDSLIWKRYKWNN